MSYYENMDIFPSHISPGILENPGSIHFEYVSGFAAVLELLKWLDTVSFMTKNSAGRHISKSFVIKSSVDVESLLFLHMLLSPKSISLCWLLFLFSFDNLREKKLVPLTK